MKSFLAIARVQLLLQCISLEIRKFQKELSAAIEDSQGSSSCGLFGSTGVEGNPGLGRRI